MLLSTVVVMLALAFPPLLSTVDAGKPEQVTQIGDDLMYATWSPDGEKIALVTDIAVYLVEPTGDGQQRLNLRASPRGIALVSVAEGDE